MGTQAEDGGDDVETMLHRRYKPELQHRHGRSDPDPTQPKLDLDEAIYGGPLFNQYGHFVLESLARLWISSDLPKIPILMSANRRLKDKNLTSWQRDILTLLNIADRIRITSQPIHVGRLHVPRPGYEIQYSFARHHDRFLARVPWNPVAGRKLWVSRGGHDTQSAHGRVEVEAALSDAGWTIFHPEAHSVQRQLDVYARSERIAGEQGSALHSLVFLKDCAGLRFDMFERDPDRSGHGVNANQATICARKGIDMRSHAIAEEIVLDRKGPHVLKKYAAPERYLERLAER